MAFCPECNEIVDPTQWGACPLCHWELPPPGAFSESQVEQVEQVELVELAELAELVDRASRLPTEPDWWGRRRRIYNVGLAVVALPAFLTYCAVVTAFEDRSWELDPGYPPPGEEPLEITLFTLIGGGVLYAMMMVVANLFYELGSAVEQWVPESWCARYRSWAFAAGCAFSWALPFGTSVLAWILHR